MYGSNEEEEMSVKGGRLYLLWLYQVCVCVCVLCEREGVCIVYGSDAGEEMSVEGVGFLCCGCIRCVCVCVRERVMVDSQ